jgi:hypothetical protein
MESVTTLKCSNGRIPAALKQTITAAAAGRTQRNTFP